MGCEEDVYKIGKKLDKMVANGAQVCYDAFLITVLWIIPSV